MPANVPSAPIASSQSSKESAKSLALFGHNQLHLGRIADAQAHCESALKIDPGNEIAKDCLEWAARMSVDEELNKADGYLVDGKKAEALALASKWARVGAEDRQRQRAWKIIDKAQARNLLEYYEEIIPTWLREIVLTVAVLAGSTLLLLIARALWRKWNRGKWYGEVDKTKGKGPLPRKPTWKMLPLFHKTTWRMLPLKELPPTDSPTGIPTNVTLDALARLGEELNQSPWKPKLLLLRPTPPADYEPAVISEFLSESLEGMELAPPPDDLRIEWRMHQVQLDQAVQNLQLKGGASVDVGSVARFLRSIVEWLTAGTPTISGVAQTSPDRASIHLAASGGPVSCIAVTTSTDAAAGIDPVQLSAERAALKFLLRMRYTFLTTGQVDGFAALRQGASQFAQYAGTVPGVSRPADKAASAGVSSGPSTDDRITLSKAGHGTVDDVETRRSTLGKAAFNFAFFRASIPRHCEISEATDSGHSLQTSDGLRQSVLLAEGVAHALVGSEQSYVSAIDCFRQLEDWPGSPETARLRQQAVYNEAIVWRQMGFEGRCVLMLTELLGETAPDLKRSDEDAPAAEEEPTQLPEALRFPVRVARLAAFAAYDREDWETLPPLRADLILDDGEKLVNDLRGLWHRDDLSARDRRLAKYMYIEALRALGHAELMRIIIGEGAGLYQNKRPVLVKEASSTLGTQAKSRLSQSIQRMQACELLSPSGELFCDLAEAYLLLGKFGKAQGYARHATLESKPDHERAYYLATETFYLEGTPASRMRARKYAECFEGVLTMDEFKLLRKELGIQERTPVTELPQTRAAS